MIDPDDDEFGDKNCDKIITFLVSCIAVYLLVIISYFLTR